MHKLRIEFSKFTVVGAINFIFTLIMFFWLVKIMKLHYLISLVTVSLLGMLLTYSLNHVWVFKPAEKLEFRSHLVKYIFAGIFSIALNVAALNYLVNRTEYDPFYIQIALIPFIVIINFSTAKFWSLKKH